MITTVLLPVGIVAAIGALSGIILVVVSKLAHVEVDDRFTAVRAVLPGANCGACGFAGCDSYAENLAAGGVKTNLCTPGGDDTARKISELLGQDFEDVHEMYAFVKCRGHLSTTEYIMEYVGPQSCKVCNNFYQGRRSCSHACLGYGDCTLVCQYDAIHIVDGVAVVDKAKCTGCGMCARECPNHLIDIVPTGSEVYVACSSTDKGTFTRKLCKNGCIGCGKCKRACPFDAIDIVDNLAWIDPAKCTNCHTCVPLCPTGAIQTYGKLTEHTDKAV